MSREIKFRAWVSDANVPWMMPWSGFWENIDFLGNPFESDGMLLMQYTGQKTSKVPYVEIYEGDVVERYEGAGYLEVVFEDGAFCLKGKDGGTFPLTKIDYVRGNIYEHPHLLQDKENIGE
jgi:hypothetical protein